MKSDDRLEQELHDQSDQEFLKSYLLDRTLAVGGAGEVYAALQLSLNRRVVIKVVRPHLAQSEESFRRFMREAKVLSRLSHPRVVRLYEFGLWKGRPFLVMELVEGGSMTNLLRPQEPLEVRQVLRIGRQVAEGLAYIHKEGILHRDIKPGNILLTQKGEAKIGDFGLIRTEGGACLTEEGHLVGTLRYMAPELLTSAEFSARSDLFALGLVLYEGLAGILPFAEVNDKGALVRLIVNTPSPPLERYREGLPQALTSLVSRLVSLDPASRPATAVEVVAELATIERALPGGDPGGVPSDGLDITHVPARLRAGPAAGPAASGLSAWLRGARGGVLAALALFATVALVVGLWVRSVPCRVLEHRLKVGPTTLSMSYVTDHACPTAVRLTTERVGVSRTVTGAIGRTRTHLVSASELPEGATIELSPVLPAGSVPTTVLVTLPSLVESQLAVVRQSRSVTVGLRTNHPARLMAQLIPVKSGRAEGAEGTPPAEEIQDMLVHSLTLEPIKPRLGYDLKVFVKFPTDEVRALPPKPVPSPLDELSGLAAAVSGLNLRAVLRNLDYKRRSVNDPVSVEPISRLLDQIDYRVRSRTLSSSISESLADASLSAGERHRLYVQLSGLRFVDHYCAARGIPFRTDVERLIPPDLVWGGSQMPAPAAEIVSVRFPFPTAILPPDYADTAILLNARVPDHFETVVQIPEGPRLQQYQICLRATRTRSLTVTVAVGMPERLLFLLRPAEVILEKDSVAMYHRVPREWIAPGPLRLTFRLQDAPGFYRNPKLTTFSLDTSNMAASCSVLEEFHIRGR